MENELFKWLATLFMSISGITVSINVKWSTKWWAYIGFFIGHVIWAIFSIIMEEWALLALNVFFAFLDIYAIIIRIYNDKDKKYEY
jgi:hypothetical protein